MRSKQENMRLNKKPAPQQSALLDVELDELLNAAKPVDELLADFQDGKESLDRDPEMALGLLKAEIVADILRVMEEEGLNKNQLARRLGKSRQYMGRVLNETANFTLESLVEMACALNRRILLRAARPSERWALSEPASLVEIPKAWERSDADDLYVEESRRRREHFLKGIGTHAENHAA